MLFVAKRHQSITQRRAPCSIRQGGRWKQPQADMVSSRSFQGLATISRSLFVRWQIAAERTWKTDKHPLHRRKYVFFFSGLFLWVIWKSALQPLLKRFNLHLFQALGSAAHLTEIQSLVFGLFGVCSFQVQAAQKILTSHWGKEYEDWVTKKAVYLFFSFLR